MRDPLVRFNLGFLSARIGEWIYVIALNWIVISQTGSAWILAIVNACRLLPSLVLSLPAGCLADKKNPQRLSFCNNLINAVVMVLCGLALHLRLPLMVVCALIIVQAVVTAVEAPFRNTYMNALFDGLRLKQAIANNASLMNVGRIIGPVVAGFALAKAGGLVTFTLAACCTAFFSLAISSLKVSAGQFSCPLESCRVDEPSVKQILKDSPSIRNLMLLAVPMMFFGFSYTAMLPVLTEKVLSLGSQELGIITAASAAGSLLASSWLGLKPELASWKQTLTYGAYFALSLVFLATAQGVISASVILFGVGYLGQAYRSCSRMHMHELVPRDIAGRVLGLSLMDRGIIPLGGLALGALTELASARFAFAVMGVGCIVCVACFLPAWHRQLVKSMLLAGAGATILLCTGCNQRSGLGDPTRVTETAASRLAAKTIAVKNVWGETAVPLSPQRIVVLDISFLDAFTALNQKVIGFAGTSDKKTPTYLDGYLKAIGSQPQFVGERKQPNLEVLTALRPELIVANPDRHALIRSQLEAIAPTVAFQDDSLADIQTMLDEFSRIIGLASQDKSRQQALRDEVLRLRKLQSTPPKVLVAGCFEDEFSTWTLSSFVGSLFEDAGAKYVFDGPPTPSEGKAEVAKLTVEAIAQLDPDQLFLYGDVNRWENQGIFKNMRAVRNGNLHQVDRDLWARARGPLAAFLILKEYEQFLTR